MRKSIECLHKWPNGNKLFNLPAQGFIILHDKEGLRVATRHEIATWRKAERKRPYKQRRFM